MLAFAVSEQTANKYIHITFFMKVMKSFIILNLKFEPEKNHLILESKYK